MATSKKQQNTVHGNAHMEVNTITKLKGKCLGKDNYQITLYLNQDIIVCSVFLKR